MKKLKQLLAVVMLCQFTLVLAQKNVFVTAKNGLSFREKPDINSTLIRTLPFGETLGFIDKTNEKLVIVDQGKNIFGNWIKVKNRNNTGYVFNGYISNFRVYKPIKINTKALDIEFCNLDTKNKEHLINLDTNDSISIRLNFTKNPYPRTLTLKNKAYKSVNVFQRFKHKINIENTVKASKKALWKTHTTNWKQINHKINNKNASLEIDKDILNETIASFLKKSESELISICGNKWYNNLKTQLKQNKKNPLLIDMLSTSIKFILTDVENNITEKVIHFELPNQN